MIEAINTIVLFWRSPTKRQSQLPQTAAGDAPRERNSEVTPAPASLGRIVRDVA